MRKQNTSLEWKLREFMHNWGIAVALVASIGGDVVYRHTSNHSEWCASVDRTYQELKKDSKLTDYEILERIIVKHYGIR